jgi:phosphoglucosamine mutase
MQKIPESSRFFGTDGIRGEAFGSFLTLEFAQRLGFATACFLAKKTLRPTLVIGKDPRTSGQALEENFIHGFSMHCEATVYKAKILPTPALAYATQALNANMGIMITASHNHRNDNGFKFFHHTQKKLTLEEEIELESFIPINAPSLHPQPIEYKDFDCEKSYIEHLKSLFPAGIFNGIKVALDTAHGATCHTSFEVIKHTGAKVFHIANTHDGHQINDRCGSEHPERLITQVQSQQAHVGFAHDGDGDRLICIDETGKIIPGEVLMALIASCLIEIQPNKNPILATTIQSNSALDQHLQGMGIQTLRTDVGDRNVAQALQAHQGFFGGESSGHYIFPHISPTGDGLITALNVLALLKHFGQPLSALAAKYPLYPQLTHNVRATKKVDLQTIPHIQKAIEAVQKAQNGEGRLLLRYSGTEPLLRILLEGPSYEDLQTQLNMLKSSFEATEGFLP